MFRVSLDRMESRRTELAEFAEKMNRLSVRLGIQIEALEAMDSFSEITVWLRRTEEEVAEQTARVKDMGAALEMVVQIYRTREEKILEYLEDGPAQEPDGALGFTVPDMPDAWSGMIVF